MSDRFDEYRRHAEFCERMAKKAGTMDSRVSWLKLAGKWRALAAPKAPEATEPEDPITAPVRKTTGSAGSPSE